MSQRDDFVDFLVPKKGWGYRVDQWRCNGLHHTADCSGFVVLGVNHVGIAEPCTNAESIGAQMVAARTTLSFAQARATKGALFEVQFTPTHHHIAVGLGDGRTIEAYDTARGVIIGTVDRRPWSICGTFPGMTGFDGTPTPNPGPATPWEASIMDMVTALVPNGKPQPKPPWLGRRPFVAFRLNPDLTTTLIGFNGARITKYADKPITHAFGMSIVDCGHLSSPVEGIGIVDEHVRTMAGLAGDGGYFPFNVTVDYL